MVHRLLTHRTPPPRQLATVRRRGLGTALVVAAVVATAPAPSASAFGAPLPCTAHVTRAVFSRWLDPAQYYLAANGDFEHGSTNWQLSSGASVVAGNEPFQVGAPADAHSLSLGAGATAESRTACVTMGQLAVRMFVKTPNVLGAVLSIDATVRNPTTGLSLTTTALVLGGTTPAGWEPTLEVLVPNLTGGILSTNLTLRITARGIPAQWRVDDVYVDPFKSR